MQTKIIINGKEVTITLTQEQLKEISQQTKNVYTVEDIKSIGSAEEILENCNFHTKFGRNDFKRLKDWITYQLETIIKATNYIDNNFNLYTTNFDNQNEYKYINWFEKKSDGWVFLGVVGRRSVSYCSLALYFKNRDSAKIIAKRFNKLYIDYIKG